MIEDKRSGCRPFLRVGEPPRNQGGRRHDPLPSFLSAAAQVPPMSPSEFAAGRIEAGTPAFWRALAALFSAGFATFAILYSVQPLLPVFAQEFAQSPAAASLALSSSTLVLAVTMMAASAISEVVGRKPVMAASLVASALLTLAVAFAAAWWQVIVLRLLAGLALSGLPAVSIAYLADEMERKALGLGVGLTIAGNAVGGMLGRLIVAALTDVGSWRLGLGAVGAIGLVLAGVFWVALPASRHFRPVALDARQIIRAFGRHLGDAGLRLLFLEALLLMAGFVTLYNFIGFRLMQPPFLLGQTEVGLVFLTYVFGMLGSTAFGRLGDRFGRRRMLWAAILVMGFGLVLTVPDQLASVVTGMAFFTFGFFGAHSTASSWVGLRAETAKAQASALYLLFYYTGSSIAGPLGGVVWSAAHWPGTVLLIAAIVAAGLAVAILLARTPPPAWMRALGAQEPLGPR
jgi:MFS transporter, YNFM family, putative membrane transport protein